VRGPDGAATYPDVTVQFVPGHPPEMVVTLVGGEKERIDLSPFTFDALHKLLQDRGLKQRPAATTAATDLPATPQTIEQPQVHPPPPPPPRSQPQPMPPAVVVSDVRLLLARDPSVDALPRSSDWLLWFAPLMIISLVVLFVRYTPTSSSSPLMFAYQRLMAKCGRRLHLDSTTAV